MPRKACEWEFIHVMAFWFFLKMPQNFKKFNVVFSVSFWSRAFSSKCPSFNMLLFLKCPILPFPESDLNTWSDLKQRRHQSWKSSIFGSFQEKSKCNHANKFFSTRFLWHFKYRTPRNITNINISGEVIYHVANKRRMEKVPLSGSKLPPSGNNGLGRAGFRRKNFRYSNSPTYIDFEANCPLNCKSTIDCSIYTLWSGENYSPIRMARDLLQTLMLR